MKGARDYHRLISQAFQYKLGRLEKLNHIDYQWGNVIFSLGSHARGDTFRISLVDESGKLEVYGIVSGQPGWTESYGWTKKGTWVKPILKYLSELKTEIETHKETIREQRRKVESEKNKVVGQRFDKFNDMFRSVN